MTASADERWTGPVADALDPRPVRASRTAVDGYVWSVVTETMEFDGALVERDILVHPGAVAVIALDEHDRVLLIRQYRHPVGQQLFEPPAGLMDKPGEPPWQTAARELAEEAGYRAGRWDVLVDVYLTPGGSSEAIRIYLARDLTALATGRLMTGEAEEQHLPRVFVPLDDARDLVLSGAIGGGSTVAGILAAHASRALGWTSLRPYDTAWAARDALESIGRVRHLHRP
ncbi:MAG: NUDIX hydrolase [Actinomycetes bacterium]|jgi:8-oxo-dGDP phosphatase